MSISKEEIIELALRYISKDEISSFPEKGDFFAMCYRELNEDKKDIKDEIKKWQFLFYGLCLDYKIDEQEKNYGKWIIMHFLNFGHFPIVPETLRLQPPHIVKGTFQNIERTLEYRFFRIPIKGQLTDLQKASNPLENKKRKSQNKKEKKVNNIVEFKRKK